MHSALRLRRDGCLDTALPAYTNRRLSVRARDLTVFVKAIAMCCLFMATLYHVRDEKSNGFLCRTSDFHNPAKFVPTAQSILDIL